MDCKICNNKTRKLSDIQFKINYYNCPNCNFIFSDPNNFVTEQEELKVYKLHENSLENAGYVKMFKDFIDKTVIPYKSNIKTALDFGSGPEPVLAHLLKEEGFDVDIYDPFFSPEKVYENKTYDLITSTEVFEHFKDPLKSFETIYKSLKPNGFLATMTLYHPQDDDKFQNWWYRRDETHISFYTHETMKHLAKIFNMKVLFLDPKNLCVMQK